MGSQFYQRDLSEVEKKYLATSLSENIEVKLIVQNFTSKGLVQGDEFIVTKATQLQCTGGISGFSAFMVRAYFIGAQVVGACA